MSAVNSEVIAILRRWYEGKPIEREDIRRLAARELAQTDTAKAFGLNESNAIDKIKQRADIFVKVAAKVVKLCSTLGFNDLDYILWHLWKLWLPISLDIAAAKDSLSRPLIQGILGIQGTGKTTLAKVIQLILAELGYSSITISLDDLYKTYAEREELRKQDPRLIWRGPPGTHAVELGLKVLEELIQASPDSLIAIPRFDKSAHNGAGDRTEPEFTKKVDVVLFEGWFVGVRPIPESQFEVFASLFKTPAELQFAKDNNRRLQAYLPLWQKLDRLIILYPVDYRLSKVWRKEAEHKMIATGKAGMSDQEIDRFVEYFWCALHPQLFIPPLLPQADLVIEINADHSVGRIYRPN